MCRKKKGKEMKKEKEKIEKGKKEKKENNVPPKYVTGRTLI
jgi:hypothetical protein